MTQRCVECGASIGRTDKWVDCCPDHNRAGPVEIVLMLIAALALAGVAYQLIGWAL